MAKVLSILVKDKVQEKSPQMTWRVFTSILLLIAGINLSIISNGLFLKEISISCTIVGFLMVLAHRELKEQKSK